MRTFNVQVLARKSGQAEKITSGVARDADDKQRLCGRWRDSGVAITEVGATNHAKLIPVLRGTDYLVPEDYMLEPVRVMGDPDRKVSWSTGRDVGRIIPHVLSHPLSRNAICPVAATAYCSWNELLAIREGALGRKVAREYLTSEQWKAIYAQQPPGRLKFVAARRAALIASGEPPATESSAG